MNKQNEKIVCGCGGSYTNRNKAVHMKTKRHQSYENVRVSVPVPVVIPVVNQAPSVDDVYKTIKNMSEDDQKKLMDMLLADTPAPVIPKEEPAEPSVFDKFRKRITEHVGEDIFINMRRPDLDEDEYDHQEEIEDTAMEILEEDDDELFNDADKVCEFKHSDTYQTLRVKDDDEELNNKKYRDLFDEFTIKKLDTFEERRLWLLQKSETFEKKVDKTPAEWAKYDYLGIMRNIMFVRENRQQRKEELQKEVDKILQRRPYLKVLL